MRKLLLASAAMLGGTMALVSVASAQAPAQSQYPYTSAAPFGLQNPSAVANVGMAPLAGPVGSAGFYGTATPGVTPLSPGNMTVRLAGRLAIYAGVATDSGRNNGGVTTAAGSAPAAQNTKLSNYGMFEYARLYPSFDAMAANGMKYGAFLEIRQDQASPPGGGANGSISASNRSRSGLYFRRETGYIGTDTLGFLRFGSTDQPTSLMLTGNFENFNDGGWNGDVPGLFTSNTAPLWPFEDVGALYSTNKIVYMSPKFFDLLDFGISYEPSTGTQGGGASGPGNCSYGNTTTASFIVAGASGNPSGCDPASSTSVFAESARRKNTFDMVARIRAAMGPVGLAATIGTIQSGRVLYNGAPTASTFKYDNMSMIDAGLQVTFGGLAVGGHVISGRENGQWNLAPKGSTDETSWLLGASYAFGPAIVGASFYTVQSAGAWTPTTVAAVGKTRTEQGIAAGGTLNLAPGINIFLSYLYGTRHQAGVDLLSGTTSGTAGVVRTNNNVKSQGLFLGTFFRW